MSKEYPDLTGGQVKQIINVFKVFVAVFAAGIAVFIFFAYQDISSLKEDYKDEVKELKDDLKSIQDFTYKKVDQAEDFYFKQLDLIKEGALDQARLSAANKIQEIFANDEEINELIKKSAKEQFDKEIAGIVEAYKNDLMNEFKENIAFTSSITILVDRVRSGDRRALYSIDSIIEKKESPVKVDAAKYIREQKKWDYYNTYKGSVKYIINQAYNMEDESKYLFLDTPPYLKFGTAKDWQDPDKSIIVDRLINTINKSNSLDDITIAWLILRKWSGINVELFDFDEFKNKQKLIRDHAIENAGYIKG